MINFLDWYHQKLTEGMPANWSPTNQIGNDSIRSAFEKIDRASKAGKQPFSGNFVDRRVIQTHLGFNDQEMQALSRFNLIVKEPYGMNIDQKRFNKFYKQLVGIPVKPNFSPPPIN